MQLALVLIALVIAVAAADSLDLVAVRAVDALDHHPSRSGSGPSVPFDGHLVRGRAVVGGLTLGLGMAALAGVVAVFDLTPATLLALATGALLVTAVSDSRLLGRQLPNHPRQVNERWLDQYRSWVYGAGFGWQIGVGLPLHHDGGRVRPHRAGGAHRPSADRAGPRRHVRPGPRAGHPARSLDHHAGRARRLPPPLRRLARRCAAARSSCRPRPPAWRP
jgi:hypothetical protein